MFPRAPCPLPHKKQKMYGPQNTRLKQLLDGYQQAEYQRTLPRLSSIEISSALDDARIGILDTFKEKNFFAGKEVREFERKHFSAKKGSFASTIFHLLSKKEKGSFPYNNEILTMPHLFWYFLVESHYCGQTFSKQQAKR